VAVSFSFDDARLSQIDVGWRCSPNTGPRRPFTSRSATWNSGWRLEEGRRRGAGDRKPLDVALLLGNFPFSAKSPLESFTLAAMEKDLDGASADIERLLGIKPVTFAYPCGQKYVAGVGDEELCSADRQAVSGGPGLPGRIAQRPAGSGPGAGDGRGFRRDELRADEEPDDSRRGAGRLACIRGHEIGKPGRQCTQAEVLEQS